jgi:hypothetical protein
VRLAGALVVEAVVVLPLLLAVGAEGKVEVGGVEGARSRRRILKIVASIIYQ